MRITRDPHDPDFVNDLDMYAGTDDGWQVIANGSSMDVSGIVEADDASGVIKLFKIDLNGVVQPVPGTNPRQPQTVAITAKTIQFVPAKMCTTCQANNLNKRAANQRAAKQWWDVQ